MLTSKEGMSMTKCTFPDLVQQQRNGTPEKCQYQRYVTTARQTRKVTDTCMTFYDSSSRRRSR